MQWFYVSEEQKDLDRAVREQFTICCSLSTMVKEVEEARERAFHDLPLALMRHRRDGGDEAAERHFRACLLMYREDLSASQVWEEPLPTARTEEGLVRLQANALEEYQRAKARLMDTLARLADLERLSGWICNEGDIPTAEKAVADNDMLAAAALAVEDARAFGPNTGAQEWADRVLASAGR